MWGCGGVNIIIYTYLTKESTCNCLGIFSGRMYIYRRTYVHTHTHAYIHTHTHIYLYIYIYMHIDMHIILSEQSKQAAALIGVPVLLLRPGLLGAGGRHRRQLRGLHPLGGEEPWGCLRFLGTPLKAYGVFLETGCWWGCDFNMKHTRQHCVLHCFLVWICFFLFWASFTWGFPGLVDCQSRFQ